jgi:succinyl-CoA synthetase beta subunit
VTVNLLEHQGKVLFASVGIAVPEGEVARSPDEAAETATRLGPPVVCKAQVPAGKRGKAGAVQVADTADEARELANRLLGSDVAGHRVDALLVEQAVDIATELYAAVLDDPQSKGPLLLFSTAGGVDIEEVNASSPELVHTLAIDIRQGIPDSELSQMLSAAGLDDPQAGAVGEALRVLFDLYREVDASLVEVNPLVLTGSGVVMALDAKIIIDAASVPRQRDRLDALPGGAPTEPATELERRGQALGLHFIELDGDVGVLANGAGLTMSTLDAVNHFGGRPANFLEIGGDAYTKATPALRLVLGNPRVRSLVVNFCGAFARTDVMTDGVLTAIEDLSPAVPIFFSIHGTGEDEAIHMVRERLGVEPYDTMDDAVRAAIAAAAGDDNAVRGEVAG